MPEIFFCQCSLTNFSDVTSICPEYYCTQLATCQEDFWRNLALVNLKLKKSTFCINVFNVGGCLASCLSFRPFLTFRPLAAWLVIKIKPVYLSSQKNTRRSIECRDHCGKIKTLKLNVSSIINYPYFAKLFKFVVVKLKFLRKASSDRLFASGCD